MPACTMKLTPLARRARSSAAASPAAALGLCATSQSEKSHWSGRRADAAALIACAAAGGEGAAGGMRGAEVLGGGGRASGGGARGGDGAGMEGRGGCWVLGVCVSAEGEEVMFRVDGWGRRDEAVCCPGEVRLRGCTDGGRELGCSL